MPLRFTPMEEKTYEVDVRHVLVVDDDVDLTIVYHDWLRSLGYVVTVVHNGAEALRVILKQDVDAILCDLMMPHMSGDMFYLAVEKARPHLCKRFIFITGYEGDPMVETFFKRVRPVILYKPITAGKLAGTLSLVMKSNGR